MAESTSTRFTRQSQTWIAKSEARANQHWPGGLVALLCDYRDGRTTIGDVTRVAGIQFRGVKRLLGKHGIPIRDYDTANKIAHQLKPEWGKHIGETKRNNPFRHSPSVTHSATRKRLRLLAAHPERHGNASVRMTHREAQFAAILSRLSIEFRFNQHASGFWLDFWFPALSIGVELQRDECIPDRSRRDAIVAALNAKAILYIPTRHLRTGHEDGIVQCMMAVRDCHSEIPNALGDCNFLCAGDRLGTVEWRGLWFRAKWNSPVASA